MNRDHLHYGSICGRQLGAMNSGHEEGKRTDDSLGCVGGKVDEGVGWLATEDRFEM